MKNKITVVLAVILSVLMLASCGKGADNKDNQQNQQKKGEIVSSDFNGVKTENAGTNEPNKGVVTSEKDKAQVEEALSFANSGMIDDAKEMLSGINPDKLSQEDLNKYGEVLIKIAEEGQKELNKTSFKAEDAVKMVEERYNISLGNDFSGLNPESEGDGRVFYKMEIELKDSNERKIIKVYENGQIDEISSRPISVG